MPMKHHFHVVTFPLRKNTTEYTYMHNNETLYITRILKQSSLIYYVLY